jgi:hypothetical protein
MSQAQQCHAQLAVGPLARATTSHPGATPTRTAAAPPHTTDQASLTPDNRRRSAPRPLPMRRCVGTWRTFPDASQEHPGSQVELIDNVIP